MTTVVLMAGGKGLRLHPLTQKVPKPLLMVGSKPILETIIDRFISQGFRRFVLCLGYKAELIEKYFGDGAGKCVITYIHEHEPLGTAGALRFFKPMNQPFIVQNADIIADVDYNNLIAVHRTQGYDATVALALYQHQVPFGVAISEGKQVLRIDEKPIESFQINAGIYVLPPNAPMLLAEGPSDMPELLNELSVGTYPISGFWCDVGHFESLAVANINWSLKIAHG